MTASATGTRSPLGDAFHVFDTTLRDGAQREGITYSVNDKLAVAHLLDDLGVGFIEGGWPGALPKDTEFFARAAAGELTLRTAQLVAFGATRKAGLSASEDPQVLALLDSKAPVVTLVAKSDVRHVERALRTTLEENLAMVSDTVAFLVAHGRRVFVDCEHFFDGFAADRDYGLRVGRGRGGRRCRRGRVVRHQRRHAADGGPSGGRARSPNAAASGWASTVRTTPGARWPTPSPRSRPAPPTSSAPPTATASGPATPTSSRCVGNLTTKLGMPVLPEGRLTEMMRVSHALAELANLPPNSHQAYVGGSAFSHKAGLHASAIKVDPDLYNHLDPAVVGNDMHILITEMAGRASVELKARELGVDLAGLPDVVTGVVDEVKTKEAAGFSYEAADASFELLLRDQIAAAAGDADGTAVRPGVLPGDRGERGRRGAVRGDGQGAHRGPPGDRHRGRQRAGQRAGLGVALGRHRPSAATGRRRTGRLQGPHPGRTGRAPSPSPGCWSPRWRGENEWTTVGVHANVVEASWQALVDSLIFALGPVGNGSGWS